MKTSFTDAIENAVKKLKIEFEENKKEILYVIDSKLLSVREWIGEMN